jgi:ribose 5-phosphate isomerase A
VTGRDELKRAAAESAIDAEVRDGMVLGLGTGSTAAFLLDGLGERLADGRLRDIAGVPTSQATAERCRELGIPLVELADRPHLDVDIDGADEVAPGLDLIKGLGGAHLHEKVIACSAARFVVVCDHSKLVERLGQHAPLPVEVIEFALPLSQPLLEREGWSWSLRLGADGRPFVTDEGNRILDCRRDDWSDPQSLAAHLSAIPGVVAHGFFLGIAVAAHVAGDDRVAVLTR